MHGVPRFSVTSRSTTGVRSRIAAQSPISSFTSSSIAIEWIRWWGVRRRESSACASTSRSASSKRPINAHGAISSS